MSAVRTPSSTCPSMDRRGSATGFGALRIAYGATLFGLALARLKAPQIGWYDPFTLVLITSAIILSILMIVGIWPRFSTFASVLLLVWVDALGPSSRTFPLIVLLCVGCILLIAPGIDALSLLRARLQWKHWRKSGTLLAPRRMPAWPLHLLTTLFTVLYLTAAWRILRGAALWPGAFPLDTPILHGGVVLLAIGWTVMLGCTTFPPHAWNERLHGFLFGANAIVACALLFAGSAPLLSLILLIGTLGLLTQTDIDALRARCSRYQRGPITVFFDGACGLCRRSIFSIALLDSLHRVQTVDFRNETLRKEFAPDLSPASLDRSLHLRTPDGRIFTGFDAFRFLSRHLPALWIVAPFLSIPGIPTIGRMVYAGIAERRKRCTHEECKI
ncbi:DUF393 domain-containing protein [Candidatus Peregrinibacteria bacterium]|nr:DUF393 domain-containing protein [Candidatus Peregrinibacteria bacterium]MBI3816048.1 DUF393 domain-containing protein [Candidatus Peregrinibacteria bacterium]